VGSERGNSEPSFTGPAYKHVIRTPPAAAGKRGTRGPPTAGFSSSLEITVTTRTVETKWYLYRQNNSGGVFRAPAINVYVEALNEDHADTRAEELGIYFGGLLDCSCCGDRWSTAEEYGGREDCPEAIKYSMDDAEPTVLPVRKVERK